jgi:MFS family permease
MPFVWSIGTIVGPALGGFYSEPASTWPEIFSPDGLFGRRPYLLPNLICAVLQLFSILAAFLWLVETHPDMQSWSTKDDLKYTTAETPLISTTGAISSAPANISQEAYGTFDHVEIRNIHPDRTKKELKRNLSSDSGISIASISRQTAFTKPVIMLVVALGM